MSIILGIYGACGFLTSAEWIHSAGAALFIDNKLVNAISEERLSRKKYDGDYPSLSIEYVLQNNKLNKKDVNIVSYTQSIHTHNKIDAIKKILSNEFSNAEIDLCDHHQSHILSAYYSSGFDKSILLSLDGAGNSYPHYFNNSMTVLEYETGLIALGNKDKITVLKHFKNGIINPSIFNLGQVYNNISRYIYSKIEPELAKKFDNPFLFMETAPGKIMGLAGYGDRKNVYIEPLFKLRVDNFYFPIIEDTVYKYDLFKKLDSYEPADIADWLQSCFENILLDFFQALDPYLKTENLCFSGGCALNILANTILIENNVFKNIHVPPWPNDVGLCIGSGIHSLVKSNNKPILPYNLSLLGKSYNKEEIMKVFNNEN